LEASVESGEMEKWGVMEASEALVVLVAYYSFLITRLIDETK
jgi:hypothetical protein